MTPGNESTPKTMFTCLCFRDAERCFDWLERVLGAERIEVHTDDEGKVAHAEIRIGDGTIMGGDQRPDSTATPPGQGVFYLVVPDADAAHRRAIEAGAEVSELSDRDYGSREFTATDPDGNRWVLGTYAGAAASGERR
jgi:uncharacterized glyoxalase superfamily protein PhnB